MDGIKYVVVTDKSIRLLVKNQYTSNVESGSIPPSKSDMRVSSHPAQVVTPNKDKVKEFSLSNSRTPPKRSTLYSSSKKHFID